jgi:hypothetical protein
MKRITVIFAVAVGTSLAFPLVARADQAILLHDATFFLGPNEMVQYTDNLIMSRTGLPTVVFDGSTGFADDETVVATIALSTRDLDGLGSAELLSSPTITGTTSAVWTTDTSSSFEFQPAIELRYTAPSAEDLGCDDHPGERFTTHLGVHATLAGSAGTTGSFSADDFPGVVSFAVTCPPSAPSSGVPTVTMPPTDTLPGSDAAGPVPDEARSLLLLAVAAGACALAVVIRPPKALQHRGRQRPRR